MGILSRLHQAVRANLGELLDRAENPAKMLEQQLLDMEDAVRDAKRQVVQVGADERKLEIQLKDRETEAAKWQTRAEQAMRHSDEGLAREALVERVREQQEVTRLSGLLEKQREYGRSLRETTRVLEQKMREARARKSEVIARHSVGEAVRERTLDAEHVGAGAGRAETGNVAIDQQMRDMDRMEDKVNALDAEWEAARELNAEISGDQRRRDLEAKFRRYEAETGIDDALAELRKKLDK